MYTQGSVTERAARLHRSEGHLMSELHSQVMPASEDDLFPGLRVGCPFPCNLEVQKRCELQGELEYEENQDANKKSKWTRKVRRARKVLSWLTREV